MGDMIFARQEMDVHFLAGLFWGWAPSFRVEICEMASGKPAWVPTIGASKRIAFLGKIGK